ncbi:MAG: hypothetical protein KDB97_00030, partial [Flavobacteriales bacterium]|nr:hypothetical protein [Flavobacteriales bacterium]
MNPIRTLLPWSLGLLLGLPTLSFGQNDLCSGALPIACGQTLSGSTISATADPEACVGNNTAPGIWYTFTGTDSSDPLAPAGAPGDQVTLSTWCQADYDSKIDVFSGTCGALVCVAGNDDTFGCSDVDSEISFATTVGTTYQVLVSGFNATSSGTFDLTMSCAAACVPVPANDDCSNAQVLTVAAYGTLVPTIGDNTCAASALNGPTCNPYGNIQDVWYTFNSGGSAEVLLTVSKTSLTQLNVVIYEGSCLGTELYCEKDLDSLHHQLPTTPNTDYYVQVYSNGPSVAGSFEIGVQASTCPNATPITCGQVIIGNTTGASVEPVVCIGNNTAPGVWYTFTGANSNDPGAAVGSTGDYIFLSTCGSNYDTKIDVFEGSCGALICVGGADDTDPEPGCLASGARVVLPTTVGTTYYVLVSGKNASDFGAFDLSMTCAPASSGPTVNIPQNGMKYVTCGGPFDLRDAGGYGNYPSSCSGYTLLQATPTSAVTIAGDLSLSDPDDYLAIYTGSGLETLVAVYDWNDGFLSYTGQPGESAIVYFFSDGDANVGPGFGLSVNWIGGCEPPANQDCANATSITCGQIINGSTSGALAHPEACVGDNTAPGVWYTFTGANSNDPGAAVGSAGDHVYLSTCGSGYDTKLDVFTGSCGALTCVAGVDDSHPTNCLPGRARLVVPTTVGTTYFILVSGKDASASGNFALTMDCAPAETGPVVLVPQTGMNYVPCGTNVTLQDAGGTGNYPSNCSGYTILEARNNSTISITGSVTFTQQEPADYLSIYRGSGFENLIASYGSDQNVAVNITGQPGEPLIVYFFSDGGVNNSAPGFDLNVTWSGPCEPATNQNCANATPISCGQTLSGYTNGASVEPDACIGNNTAPGVWYTFTGANSDDPGAAIGSAGDLVYLSTCGGTLYDTKIDVFEGSCGALTCVDGNDDPASNFCF